jgi:hypothetical protein
VWIGGALFRVYLNVHSSYSNQRMSIQDMKLPRQTLFFVVSG